MNPLTQIAQLVKLPYVQNELTSIARFLDQTILKLKAELEKAEKARAALGDVGSVPTPRDGAGPAKPGSVGDHLMTILRTEGPLQVKTIHEKMSARGKITDYHTLSSMISYYLRRGYVVRTAPRTYGIAIGAPTPKNTNGAHVPKALR